jgi:hypothetical protein
MAKAKPTSWGGNRKGAGPKRKAPEGSRTATYELWPEHLAAIAHLARTKEMSKSAAARALIEKGKSALGLRINKQLDY